MGGAQTLTGTVFDDGDGRQDRGESGIADVALSNGRALVSTDAHGRCRATTPPARAPAYLRRAEPLKAIPPFGNPIGNDGGIRFAGSALRVLPHGLRSERH
jgi:hypothetical protein